MVLYQYNNKRYIFIDYLRAIAILLVILCHAIQFIYKNGTGVHLPLVNLSFQSRLFAVILFSLSRIGVPFFLMISGYLLLDREYDNDSTFLFYKKRFVRLLIVCMIWMFFYTVYYGFKYGQIGFFEFFKNTLLINKVDYNKVFDHTWYIYQILGVYLIVPLISQVNKAFDLKVFIIPFIVVIFYNFVVPTTSVFYQCLKAKTFTSQISTNIVAGFFGIYVIIGGLLKRNLFARLSNKSLLLTSFISFTFIVWMQLYAYSKGVDYNVWYDNFFLLLGSSALFTLFSRIRFKTNIIISYIAKYSFPVYLIHKIVLDIFGEMVVSMDNMMSTKTIILLIVMFVVSFVISIVVSMIPKIGKYILYMK